MVHLGKYEWPRYLLTKPKNRFAKVIEIIEQEKHNFKFRRGNLGEDNFRCTIGLLLGHYGWTGYSCSSIDYDVADNKLHELISTEEQRFIASINDNSEHFILYRKYIKEMKYFVYEM